jgi:hypothetical protein
MSPHAAGCLVCGRRLAYRTATEPMACALCGETRPGTARCTSGHFACDACHGGSAKDAIERLCRATESRDPVEIALQAMRHPAVKVHGPEHHFLVPAALLAAWCNARGEQDQKAARLAETRQRSDPVAGGFCGIQGACGAGIGAGIFVSVVTGATPLTGESRGLANQATAQALDLISRTGGARCCKRDGWLALLAAVRFARTRLGVSLEGVGPSCEFGDRNPECLADDCPFHREARR